MQKGSAQLLSILAVLLVLIVGGVYLYPKIKGDNLVSVSELSSPKKIDLKEYSNQALGFTFKYANELTVKEDTEEEFDKRGNGDFRKNFKGYVQYEPGKFLGAVVALDKDQKYETNPFTVWVFDNENNFTIDQWYQKYWYYPFVWGDFTSKGKIELAPKDEATISGEIAQSGIIDYQPGKPKFVYLAKDQKMYLFRIIGETGDKILYSFTF